ncbi:MAG: hypothetical protein IIX04_05315 [Alistipes sp.]|nr:hypothetical protein [Alistipes sp.]
MVIGWQKHPINAPINYPLVTLSLYIPRSLGLNMIEPHKPLIDSGLAVFLFADSNKTAPKAMKNAPIFGRGGQNKFTMNYPSSRRWRKGKHIF